MPSFVIIALQSSYDSGKMRPKSELSLLLILSLVSLDPTSTLPGNDLSYWVSSFSLSVVPRAQQRVFSFDLFLLVFHIVLLFNILIVGRSNFPQTNTNIIIV